MLQVKWLKRLILISYFLIILLYIELLTHYKYNDATLKNYFYYLIKLSVIYFMSVYREHQAIIWS